MRRKKISAEEIRERIEAARKERAERDLEKKEFDQTYRRSLFFRSSFIVRGVMTLFCAYFYFFDSVPFYPKTELIASSTVEEEVVELKREKYVNIYIHIRTVEGNYYNIDVSQSDGGSESFYKGDTIRIVHSVLNKPSYLSISGGSVFYILTKHLVFKQVFLFAGIACALSLFMISGYEKASRYFVKFITYLVPVIILVYLVL